MDKVTTEERGAIDAWAAELRERHAKLLARSIEELDVQSVQLWRSVGESDSVIIERQAIAELNPSWPLPWPEWATDVDLGSMIAGLEVCATFTGQMYRAGDVSAWLMRVDVLNAADDDAHPEVGVDPAGTLSLGRTSIAYAAPDELSAEDAANLATVLDQASRELEQIEYDEAGGDSQMVGFE